LISSRTYGATVNTDELRRVFVARVHQLLELGYRRIKVEELASQAEPVITGELARAMNAAIDDDESPKWTHNFQVEDEQPVNNGIRKGKYRKRIDIGIRSSSPRPRHHFSFEAKLLGQKNPLRNYLGAEGLQCFLRGEYAADEKDAGMLGYVQSGTEAQWAQVLSNEFRVAGARHGVCDDCSGLEHRFKAGPAHTYHSQHFRPNLGERIDIFHTFLSFQ